MSHTPGPWHAANVSPKTWHMGVYQSDGSPIATLTVHSALHVARRKSDAALIAAAPELLAALEDALSIFAPEPGEKHPAPMWADRAAAAIAKAAGADHA